MDGLLDRDPHWFLLVLAWVAAAVTLLMTLVLAARNRPREPSRRPATMELGPEPPAVVGLLTGGFRVTAEAVPATLLDLAARGWLRIDQVDEGPVVAVRGRRGKGSLARYDQRVLEHVRGLARDGIVPAAVLTTGPEDASRGWWRSFRVEVIEDAQGRGLCVKRWSRPQIVAMWVGVVVSGILFRASYGLGDPGAPADWRGIAFLVGVLGLLGIAWVVARFSASLHQRDTDAGLAAASHWSAVRSHLADGAFADKPAASVILWERYLAYAAAMGLAPTVVRDLPLGAEDDERAWSRSTGVWRPVRVSYPRFRPAWGRRPPVAILVALARGAILGAIVWLAVRAADLDLVRDLDRDARRWVSGVGSAVAILLIPAIVWQVATVVMAVTDLFHRREARGVVVRKRLFIGRWHRRAGRAVGEGADPRFYLAVDAGTGDRVAAWRVRAEVWGRAAQGEEVVATVTPLLGHVEAVEPASEPPARGPRPR